MGVIRDRHNADVAEVVIERRGLRISRLTVDGFDMTHIARRAEVVIDPNDGPVVKLELVARATIVDVEHDPIAELVEDQVMAWPELEAAQDAEPTVPA